MIKSTRVACACNIQFHIVTLNFCPDCTNIGPVYQSLSAPQVSIVGGSKQWFESCMYIAMDT